MIFVSKPISEHAAERAGLKPSKLGGQTYFREQFVTWKNMLGCHFLERLIRGEELWLGPVLNKIRLYRQLRIDAGGWRPSPFTIDENCWFLSSLGDYKIGICCKRDMLLDRVALSQVRQRIGSGTQLITIKDPKELLSSYREVSRMNVFDTKSYRDIVEQGKRYLDLGAEESLKLFKAYAHIFYEKVVMDMKDRERGASLFGVFLFTKRKRKVKFKSTNYENKQIFVPSEPSNNDTLTAPFCR